MQKTDWQLVSLDRALARYGDAWQTLCMSLAINPSLAPGWVALGCDALRVRDGVEVLIGTNANELVAALPVRIIRRRMLGLPITTAEIGGGAVNYHVEIASQLAPTIVLRALAAELQRRGGWHVLVAPNIQLDTPTARALQEVATLDAAHVDIHPTERSPFLPVSGTWDKYLATRNKAFRYSVRRQAKDAAAAGDNEIRWFTKPQDVAEFWHALLAVEAHSWKAAKGRAISSRPVELRYNEALLPYLAAHDMLLGNVLYIDGRPIAYNLCCRSGSWVGQLKTSFDDEFAKIRPGALIVQSMVERVFSAGASEFDFLGDAQPHKLEWTDAIREHAEFRVYSSTWLARLMHRLKRARPPAQLVSE